MTSGHSENYTTLTDATVDTKVQRTRMSEIRVDTKITQAGMIEIRVDTKIQHADGIWQWWCLKTSFY